MGPVMTGGNGLKNVLATWYQSSFRFSCNRSQPEGKRLLLLWADPAVVHQVYSGSPTLDEIRKEGVFPETFLKGVSYKYAAVAELSLKVAPILLDQNWDELDALFYEMRVGAAGLLKPGLAGPKAPRQRPPVLLAPETYRCRRHMVPVLNVAMAPTADKGSMYYLPAYNLTVNPIIIDKLGAKAVAAWFTNIGNGGRDVEQLHTDCTRAVDGFKNPRVDCICLPVTVSHVFQANSLGKPRLVPFTHTQDLKYLRFYGESGPVFNMSDATALEAYNKALLNVQQKKNAKTTKLTVSSKFEQECVVNGVRFGNAAVYEAILRVAWSAWLWCEPDARERLLLSACTRGDAAAAREAIAAMRSAGDDAPTLTRADGKTALHFAAQNGLTGVVASLFATWYRAPKPGKRGPPGGPADEVLLPNARDYFGATPLHAAILTGQTDTALLIIASRSWSRASAKLENVSLSARDNAGDTPMHLAARRGDIEVLQRLLARGAPVDAVNAAGRTPLDVAEAQGRGKAVQLLAYATEMLATSRKTQLPPEPDDVADALRQSMEHNPNDFTQRDQLRKAFLTVPKPAKAVAHVPDTPAEIAAAALAAAASAKATASGGGAAK